MSAKTLIWINIICAAVSFGTGNYLLCILQLVLALAIISITPSKDLKD